MEYAAVHQIWGVGVDLTVTVVGSEAGDEARELQRWLADEEELRGQVRLVERAPEPGTLGALVHALAVGIAPGGAATAFAAAIVSWIRHCRGDIRAVVRRSDGIEIEVSAERVSGLDASALRSFVAELSRSVGDGEGMDDGGASPQPA